jgi:hypothetical protein
LINNIDEVAGAAIILAGFILLKLKSNIMLLITIFAAFGLLQNFIQN